MDKSHKKQKIHKSINYKKFVNPLFINIEEYNRAMILIPKELDKNNEMRDLEEKLFDIYEEIKMATNEYCEKLRQISKELNPNEKNNEGKIQKVIYDILIYSIEELEIAMKSFKKKKSQNYKKFDEYNIQFEDFNKELVNNIELFDSKRKEYIEEMKKYEAYLINKELGSQDNIENDNNKKENKKKDKNKDKNTLNDNHAKVYEKQETYIEHKNKLRDFFKKAFDDINSERMLVYQSFSRNCIIFHQVINEGLKNIDKIIQNEESFIKNDINNSSDDLIDVESMINNLMKDEFYSFKFLSIDKNKLRKISIEDDPTNKKKKKDKKDKKEILNVDNLLQNINDDNIISLISNIRNHNIKLNKDNMDKIKIFEERKVIESIIDLIIREPDKYDDNNKNKLMTLLDSSVENHYSFMKYLNNYRTNGLFELKKPTIIILCDLFNYIVEKAAQNNDYKMVQYTFILSLTYYHYDDKNSENTDDNCNKIYMSKYLKNSKPFHDKNFWVNYFQSLVFDEEEKLIKRNEGPISGKKKSVIAYTTVFTLIKNMADYDLDFNFIYEIIQEIFTRYKFKDSEKSALVNYLMSEIEKNSKKK